MTPTYVMDSWKASQAQEPRGACPFCGKPFIIMLMAFSNEKVEDATIRCFGGHEFQMPCKRDPSVVASLMSDGRFVVHR